MNTPDTCSHVLTVKNRKQKKIIIVNIQKDLVDPNKGKQC